MKSTNILTSTLAAFLAGSTHGLATPPKGQPAVESPVEGFGVVELTWEVETTPGGSKAVLNGTIEEVHSQLLQINPSYDDEFAPIAAERLKAAAEKRTGGLDETRLQKRDWTICGTAGYGHERAKMFAIAGGISYLRGLSGEALNGPGPRNCGRVSCSDNSAIWYCNNNNYYKSMPWFHVANAAQVLVDNCSEYYDWQWRTRGERWHDDGWFAIVSGSAC